MELDRNKSGVSGRGITMAEYTKGEWIKDYGGTKGHIKAVPEGAEAHNTVPEAMSRDYKLIPTPTVCKYDVNTPSLTEEEKQANADRIVDCVNGCKDIENPLAVKELYEALKEIYEDYGFAFIKDILAKAGGKDAT